MATEHATDPAGFSHPQNTGDSSNPVSLQHLFDEWNQAHIVDHATALLLCTLSTEQIQRALDNAFFDHEDEWQKLINAIRLDATKALVQVLDNA